MKDVALLTLRLTVGGLLAGHGAQKLFGWFGGHGMKGTAGWLESIGMRPGSRWALAAGASEFGGGLLTALGLGGSLGPVATMGAMGMATGTVHWGKPIWGTEGGAELPATNLAVAAALTLMGPGRYSLDRALGVRVPWWLTGLALGATAAGITLGLTTRSAPPAVPGAGLSGPAQEPEQPHQPLEQGEHTPERPAGSASSAVPAAPAGPAASRGE